MNVGAIFVIAVIGLSVGPEASAIRIACYGSNEERLLAREAASADKQVVASLPALLDSVARETNSKLLTFGAFKSTSADEQREYRLTEELGRFVVTLKEKNSTSVILSVERSCRNRDAEGWQSYWTKVHSRLEQNGFNYE